jgi:hypothetical protein
MSKTRIIQNSLVSGVLSKTLRGRVDINKYYSGVEQADNVIIMAHGGVERRYGLKNAIENSTPVSGIDYFSIVPRFVNWDYPNDLNNYVVLSDANFILFQEDVAVDSVTVASVLGTDLSQSEIDNMDYVQVERIIYLFFGTRQPVKIDLATATTLSVTLLAFEDMPIYDFTAQYSGVKEKYIGDGVNKEFIMLYSGDIFTVYLNSVKQIRTTHFTFDSTAQKITFVTAPAADDVVEVVSGYIGLPLDSDSPFEDIWSDARGWPRTATVHQNRLVVGGTDSKPSSVWQSIPGSFTDFNTGAGFVNDAIFDTLDTLSYNEITNVVSNRSLQVFTRNAEFYNLANPITPPSSSWQQQSVYGNKRIGVVQIDGSSYYIDKNGKDLRSFLYNYDEDGYASAAVSLLADDITNDVTDVASITGTESSVSNYIYVVNGDGTIAALNVMRSEGINGWTSIITDGNAKRVETINEVMYFIVERTTGTYYIEKMDSTYTMDHSTKATGAVSRVEIQSILPSLDLTKEYTIIADGSFLGTALAYLDTGKYYVDLPRDSVATVEVGFAPEIVIKTMPLTASTNEAGVLVNQRKRVIRVILNLFESLGISVESNLMPDRQFVVTLDESPEPYTGIKEIYLLGYSRTTQITIEQSVPLPFTLLQIDHELEY